MIKKILTISLFVGTELETVAKSGSLSAKLLS